MFDKIQVLKRTLNTLEGIYDDRYLYTSVLSVVRRFFPQANDKETWALFCALVDKQIPVVSRLIPMLEGLALEIMEHHDNFIQFVQEEPKHQKEVLTNFSWHSNTKKGLKQYQGWSHRLITSDTITCFFTHLKGFLNEYDTLLNFFKTSYLQSNTEPRIEGVIRGFCRELLNQDCPPSCKIRRKNYQGCKILGTMIPNPQGSSAFKTICLFLRWMVRPHPDLEMWNFIPTSELLYPLDVGVMRVLERLQLITRKKSTWLMVLDSTKAIKTFFDEKDPVKFDFALSRLGILRSCQKTLEKSHCFVCPFGIEKVCPSAVTASDVDKWHETMLKQDKMRQLNRIKGEYLELKILEALVKEGYHPDYAFKYLPVLSPYSELLLQHDCMTQGKRMELDVVVRNITDPRKFKVVECKYHAQPISRKDVECFGIKIANFKELLQDAKEMSVDGMIEEVWFVAPNGFAHGCEEVAAKHEMKLFDRSGLNQLFQEKGLKTILDL